MRGTRTGDAGATAVLTAVLAVVLFGFAALAVELTDMYSRDRASQTTADLAALAGAQELPDPCAAALVARETLAQGGNAVRDDAGSDVYSASFVELSDGDLTNGEIQVLTGLDPDNPPTSPADPTWIDTSGCTAPGSLTTARVVRVITPPRTKEFTLAAVLPDAPQQGEVRRIAAVAVRSPQLKDVLPTFLPDSCGFGSNYVVTNSPSAGGGPSETPNFTPNGVSEANQNNAPKIVSVTSSRVDGGIVQEITVRVENLTVAPTSATTTRFDFHTGRASTTERHPPATSPPSSSPGVLADEVRNATTTAPYSAEYVITLPVQITALGGKWWVRAEEPTAPGVNWTAVATAKSFEVTAQLAPGCGDPATGDFGLLDVDRGAPSDTLQNNIIFGLEQGFATLPQAPPTASTPCAGGGPTGALLSNQDPRNEPANCVDIDPGRDAGIVTRGFITGDAGPGEPFGRLDASNYDTAGLDPGCGPGGLTWRTPVTPERPVIVNTSLSCYTGTPLVDLQTCDSCIDKAIFEDPRFFFVPVLYSPDRPSSGPNQWPIKEFRAAFITNETGSSGATCESAVKCNGIEFNTGSQSIFALQTFVFPLSALPDELPSDFTGDGSEYTGSGPKDFLLVE